MPQVQRCMIVATSIHKYLYRQNIGMVTAKYRKKMDSYHISLYCKRAQSSEQNSPLVKASCQRADGQMP